MNTSKITTTLSTFLVIIIFVVAGIFIFQDFEQKKATYVKPVATAFYTCKDDKTINANFYETPMRVVSKPGQPPVPTGSVVLKLSDGRTLTLKQTISADGARYAGDDESFVFWSKGSGAFVLENGVAQNYIDCVTQTP